MTATIDGPTDVGEQLSEAFIDAVAAGRYDDLEAVLASEVRFRALLPRRVAEETSAAGARDLVAGWFADCDRIELLDRRVGRVGDRIHAGYRLRVREDGSWLEIQQELFATPRDGRLEQVALLCSGFRPLPDDAADAIAGGNATGRLASAGGGTATDLPVPQAVLEALGEGCATLTPRIRAAIGALEPGQVLEVVTDDPDAAESLRAWSRLTRHALIGASPDAAGQATRYYLRRA